MTLELNSFIGAHELSGAFFDSICEEAYKSAGYEEEKQVLRFTLDGINFEAVEDPSDGYRSGLGCVRHTQHQPENRFAPIKVEGKMKTVGEYGGKDDILQFISIKSGKPVLEIGTADIDDYYPGFVAIFAPDNA